MDIANRPWASLKPPLLPMPFYNGPPGFETLADVHQRRRVLLNALADHAPDESSVIQRIYHCHYSGTCGSGACPLCNRAFRMRLHSESMRMIPHDSEILQFSLIPSASRVEPGGLGEFDLARWTKSRQRGLARALPQEAVLIGGVDVSFNTTANADTHWCFHVYGFALFPAGWGLASAKRLAALRASIEIHNPGLVGGFGSVRYRPLRVGPRTRAAFETSLLYSHKAIFSRRSRYFEERRTTGRLSTNTDSYALRPDQLAELSILLDRYPLGTRLILRGLRRRGPFSDFRLS